MDCKQVHNSLSQLLSIAGLTAMVAVCLIPPSQVLGQGVSDCCLPACGLPENCDGCNACDELSGGESAMLFPELSQLRKSLGEGGIVLQNNVTQFYIGDVAGGVEREFRYAGHGDYLTNIDFGKLGVQEGLFVKMRAEHRFGESLGEATGVILPPNVAADLPVVDSEHLYLTNLVVTQALSESFVLFAGKMDTLDGDINAFAHGRGIRQFSNSGFVANPIALRTVPYSTLGAGFAVLDEGEPLWSFLVLNPTDTARTSGFDELFAEGVSLSTEVRVPTHFFGRLGHQLIGGTWSSREVVALDQDARIILPSVPVARQSGSWSLYWNCDQILFADSRQPSGGWGYFARAGMGDAQTNPLAYFLSAGLGGSSPWSSRSHDNFGLGYYYAASSNDIAPFISSVLGGFGDGQGVECFYNVGVNSALTITPDLQVLSPSRESIDTALVAGLRVNLAF